MRRFEDTVPALTEDNIRHLLRRTEVVDRAHRVDHLLGLGSIAAAVDDVLDVDTRPPSAVFDSSVDFTRGEELTAFWIERLVGVDRNFGERLAFFWHGHLCCEFTKAGGSSPMRDQIDLFRRNGLADDIPSLVKTVAIQPAMLRYLDNDENFASSPNQNFGRELLELFLLGVGNYTEADVEAATAAWTGHTIDPDSKQYRWRADRHEAATQRFLGRSINDGDPREGGNEVIDVVLGSGTVSVGPRAGDRSRDVAADFLSLKLWQEFGEADSGLVPEGVATAMRTALVSSSFSIRPWVRAMLTHDDFYESATRTGLVRQPIEYAVALLVATGLPSTRVAPSWLLEEAGQRPLFPPNVSGWKPNRYWVHQGSMIARHRMAIRAGWDLHTTYWVHEWARRDENYMQFAGGRVYQSEITGFGDEPPMSSPDLVDKFAELMDLRLSETFRSTIIDYCDSISDAERYEAYLPILIDPAMHLA